MEFEEALIQSLLQLRNQTKNKNFQTFFNVARGFNDLSDESISTDVSRLVGGISIVYMYVLFMLGGFDCVNQKVNKYLSKLSKENISSNKFLLCFGTCSGKLLIPYRILFQFCKAGPHIPTESFTRKVWEFCFPNRVAFVVSLLASDVD